MNARPPLLAGLALTSLCGCATTVSVVDAPKTPDAGPRIPLTACYVPDRYDSLKSGRRYAVAAWMAGAAGIFAVEKAQFESLDPSCDLKLVVNTMNSNLDVYAARSGRSLFALQRTFGINPMPRLRAALLQRFATDAELVASVQAERPAAPAPERRVEEPAPAKAAAGPLRSPRFKAAERPDDLAVVVGIDRYSDIEAKAAFAERDARAFKAYVRALGVPERNIVLLLGPKAGKASVEKYLEVWLARLAKPDSRVYVYFSGHGAPDVKTGQSYLVPWDGDPNFLQATAYPLARLYKTLDQLPADRVFVALDSCFSGAGGRSVLATGARPLVTTVDPVRPPAKVTVLAAAAAAEISGSLEDKGHGAFTWFLLEGLDAGLRTPTELNAYLRPRVQDEARRLNRDQTPQLQGDGDWPLRP